MVIMTLVLHIAPIGGLAVLVAFVIPEVGVHHDLIAVVLGLEEHIEHAAHDAVEAAVIIIGIELGHAAEKRGLCPGGLNGHPVRGAVEQLLHMDAQGAGDLINRLDIQDDLPVFILGNSRFAFADNSRKGFQCHFAFFAESADLFSDFCTDLGHRLSHSFYRLK